MTENYKVCNCNNVSYNDIVNVLHEAEKINDVLIAF